MNQSVLHYTGFEHPPNQSKNPWISNPQFEKLQKPLVIDMIEKSSDVRFHNPAHFLPLDRSAQSAQRIMTTTSRPVSIAAVQKVCFIDPFQHSRHCHLNHFVLN